MGKPGERDHLEDPGINGRGVNGRILRWIFRKCNEGGTWTGLIWLRIRRGGRHLLT